jgi:hypothetical protein
MTNQINIYSGFQVNISFHCVAKKIWGYLRFKTVKFGVIKYRIKKNNKKNHFPYESLGKV